MKKGFTLVELLAVIIILGIILVIAIPSFNNAIKESKIKLYKSINQMVVKSTKEYLTEYVYELPEEEGETIEVTTNDLISNGYLKEISNPTDKNDTCTGYVLITKLENNEYSYIPHINCEEDINNSTEDGLVLHYTFDDFQEPTENILPIEKQQFTSGWGSYESSILNWTFNQRVDEWNTSDAVRVQTFGGTNKLKIICQITCPGVLGTKYASQIKVKNIGNKKALIRNQYGSSNTINPGETLTVQQYAVGNGSSCYQFRIETDIISDSLDLYLYKPQVENKAYWTPYVESARTGTVKDYSGNNNVSNLSLDTTPRWMSNTDGISGYYDLISGKWMTVGHSQSLNLNSFTINVWVKYRDYTYPKTFGAIKKSSPNCYLSTGKGFDFGHGYQSLGLDVCLGDGVHVVRNTLQFNLGNRPPDLLNKWTHLSLVVDRSNGYIYSYINGELQSHKVNISSVTGDINTTASLTIGTLYGWTTDASLDDFRIYNRVLNAEEIKFIYEMTK